MTLISYHCLEMTIYEYAKKSARTAGTVTDGEKENF